MDKMFDVIDTWLWPWAKWADRHGIPEVFWGFHEFWWHVSRPRLLWQRFDEHWFAPQQECIDWIDFGVGLQCVGYYDTPSRFMVGVYWLRSWVDPRYWYYRAKGYL